MLRFEVELALKALGEEIKKWKVAYREFATEYDKVLNRLIHEAVANRMSVEQISKDIGLTPSVVRMKMRRMGLDPKKGRAALAHSAAEALRTNAELLGVDPLDMDLSSPLAYLPAGSQLQKQMQSEAVKGVKELDEPVHGINFVDDEVGCGMNGWGEPFLISHDIDRITCEGCRKRLILNG